jgi:hypothetical protein
MQNTATVNIEKVSLEEQPKNESYKKERDFLSELKPIQLDWPLEERARLVEIALETNPQSMQVEASETLKKAIRRHLEDLKRDNVT